MYSRDLPPHFSMYVGQIATIHTKCCTDLLVVKYHVRRGVGLIKFLENGSRPQPHTSHPTWHDIFESSFKAQSSKLERLFCHDKVKRDVEALSFERAFENVTPRGVVFTTYYLYKCIKSQLAPNYTTCNRSFTKIQSIN